MIVCLGTSNQGLVKLQYPGRCPWAEAWNARKGVRKKPKYNFFTETDLEIMIISTHWGILIDATPSVDDDFSIIFSGFALKNRPCRWHSHTPHFLLFLTNPIYGMFALSKTWRGGMENGTSGHVICHALLLRMPLHPMLGIMARSGPPHLIPLTN